MYTNRILSRLTPLLLLAASVIGFSSIGFCQDYNQTVRQVREELSGIRPAQAEQLLKSANALAKTDSQKAELERLTELTSSMNQWKTYAVKV